MEEQAADVVEKGVERGRDGEGLPARRHRGLQYLVFLKRFCEIAQPTSYLEIGTRDGSSLAAFDCDAIAVDPKMRPKPVALNRRSTHCFQMTSDRFFAEQDVSAIFPRGVDVAFLDGMHRFEFLLRDFINTERCCHRRSTVIVHDCFPAAPELTTRESGGGAWAGDAWKLVPILKELRDDLVLRMLDCPPTGLLLIQGLDRDSEALSRDYHSVVQRYADMALSEYGVERLWADVEPLDSRKLTENETLWSLALANY